MTPALVHAQRHIGSEAARFATCLVRNGLASARASAFSRGSICLQCPRCCLATICQYRHPLDYRRAKGCPPTSRRRHFSSGPWRSKDALPGASKSNHAPAETKHKVGPRDVAGTIATPGRESTVVHTVPDEELPSHRETKRWTLSKRFYKIMDELMPKLAIASQHINNYTGTDYTGIEALRREIKEQEQLVKSRHSAVHKAKEVLDAAHAKRAASQKEVVGLLERKHSWAQNDLERYMSLIRSEHLDEQEVQAAKDAVSAAETALEESRTRLEKRERAQYHEEQIWSDTIRRNSTWVTFGLMGFNIFILLATVVVIEPWRRRRLVKEIRTAFEANKPGLMEGVSSVPVKDEASVNEQIDAAVEPVGLATEKLEQHPVDSPLLVESVLTVEREEDVTPLEVFQPWSVNGVKTQLRQLFSEQRVVLRKMDITTIAIEGAAAGAALASLLFVVFRPR